MQGSDKKLVKTPSIIVGGGGGKTKYWGDF